MLNRLLPAAPLLLALVTGCGSASPNVVAADDPDPAATATGSLGGGGRGGSTGDAGDALMPACNRGVVHDGPEGLGFPTVAEAVSRSRTPATPDSLTVRKLSRKSAFVRERVARRLTVYTVKRGPAGWKVEVDTYGPVGCAPLEAEFARPGKPLALPKLGHPRPGRDFTR